ncbi:MAG: chorismate mutase, partial [Rubrivivax sp.]
MNPALLALREQIDAVDRELLTLLNRRAGLALEVGEIKKHEGSPVFRPERE